MENKFLAYITDLFSSRKPEPVQPEPVQTPKADFLTSGDSTPLFAFSYNGEKNLGELGPIIHYTPDYVGLRARSWQSYIESEITQTTINRFLTWVIGKGLKLQAEPLEALLKTEGVQLKTQEFSEPVEARFAAFRKSIKSSYSGMENLDKTAFNAYKNAIIGGDVLVIIRYDKKTGTTIQLKDGSHVQSPIYGSEYYPAELKNGNTLKNGIEIDARGQHVRYYIRTRSGKFETVEARSQQTGLQIAFLVYGLEYRMDNVRGLPLISTVLETLKKLERYKEATVGSAEERQKIAFSIEHENYSTGENPFAKQLANSLNVSEQADLPKDINGTDLSNLVAATTNKQAVNLPIGGKLKMHEGKAEIHFRDFYSVNIELICAALGIPTEVAMMKYDSNFSASRAALKDWENSLNVAREKFAQSFYQPIYNFWLDIQILENKINAPGYLKARMEENDMVISAYQNARFIGAQVPHIDPLKEVNAERAKLGEAAKHIPLTTVEQATEVLNGGDSDENIKQFGEELSLAKTSGIEPSQQVQQMQPNKENKDDKED